MAIQVNYNSLKTVAVVFVTSAISIFVTLLFTSARVNDEHLQAVETITQGIKKTKAIHLKVINSLHKEIYDDEISRFNKVIIPAMYGSVKPCEKALYGSERCIEKAVAEEIARKVLIDFRESAAQIFQERRKRLDDATNMYDAMIDSNHELAYFLQAVTQSQNAVERFVTRLAENLGLPHPVSGKVKDGGLKVSKK